MGVELSSYVDRLLQEGRRHSQGEFSLDAVQALRKLSRRLFADPHAYLLKLTQAAVRAGASSLDFVASEDRLELRFDATGFSSSQMARFAETFDNLWDQEMQEPAWAHLVRGLQAARTVSAQNLIWALQDQAGGVGYRIAPDDLERLEIPAGQPGPTRCLVCLSRPGGERWRSERQLLEKRCGLAPVPIFWNGKLLNPTLPPPNSRDSSFACLVDRLVLAREPARELLALPHLTRLGAEIYDLGAGDQDQYSFGGSLLHQWRCYAPRAGQEELYPTGYRPDFRLEQSDFFQDLFGIDAEAYALNHGFTRPGRLDGRGRGYQILLVPQLGDWTRADFPAPQGRFGSRRPLAARAWLRVPGYPEDNRSSLAVQQDGVLLDPVEFSAGLAGVRCFLADAELTTDLSGLTLRQDARLQAVLDWLTEECARIRKEVRRPLRWNGKHRISDAWVEGVYAIHQLDPPDDR